MFDDALVEKARMQCKIQTIIAAYNGPAFCEWSTQCKRPKVIADKAYLARVNAKPGVLRRYLGELIARHGEQAGAAKAVAEYRS